jgi:hypothetical protein
MGYFNQEQTIAKYVYQLNIVCIKNNFSLWNGISLFGYQ